MLYAEDATKLTALAPDTNLEYFEILSEYIAGSSYETASRTQTNRAYWFSTPQTYNGNGTVEANYNEIFHFSDSVDLIFRNPIYRTGFTARGSFKGCFNAFIVDINGTKTKPNVMGKDLFMFYLDDSGSVVAAGSQDYSWLTGRDSDKYDADGNNACNENSVTTGNGCSGSILDNNMKVIYQ